MVRRDRPTSRGRPSGPVTTRLTVQSQSSRSTSVRVEGAGVLAVDPAPGLAGEGGPVDRRSCAAGRARIGPSAPARRGCARASSAIRTSASARRRAGGAGVAVGGRVGERVDRGVDGLGRGRGQVGLDERRGRRRPVEIVSPSCSRGQVPSARAQLRKWAHARRSSRRSSGSGEIQQEQVRARRSFRSCPSTRAAAIVRAAPAVISPSRHAAPIVGSSSHTSPASIAARASPSRIPV